VFNASVLYMLLMSFDSSDAAEASRTSMALLAVASALHTILSFSGPPNGAIACRKARVTLLKLASALVLTPRPPRCCWTR
jgi:hypothetical protein